ncbi:MAG: HAMP domain-containing sensor histidine kinase [Anaerolineae bacterium]
MTAPIPDTLPSVLKVHPDIVRLERYLPLGLSVHATLLFLYARTLDAASLVVWFGFVAALVASTWLLIQVDKRHHFTLFRAIYLASTVWALAISLHTTIVFLVIWHLGICIIYTPLLPQRQALAFLLGTAGSYIVLYPVTPDAAPLPFGLLRAGVILFVGWVSYTLNVRVVKAMLEHQETRQQLINTEVAREQLGKEKELYEQKMEFVALVSHEFRTPLAIIESAGYLLEQYYEQMTPTKRANRIQEIRSQTIRLAEMLDNIVTAEKLLILPSPSVHRTPLNLRELCDIVVEDLNGLAPEQPRIVPVYEGPLETTMVDSDHVRVILYHLLSNALKFSPPQSEVRLYVCRAEQQLLLQVVDHGVGISDSERQRLYQPFFRSDSAAFIKGLGLGLTLVYESVRQQGGSINWRSEPDTGTMFEVRLPLDKPESR